MEKYFKGIRIKTRITINYITILILSIGLTFGIISVLNKHYTEKEIGNAGVQTVNALAGNLSLIFDNVTQFSDLIYFDDHVQDSLADVESASIDPVIQRTIKKSLINMILSGDYISNVFIFDKFLNYYNSYKVGPVNVKAQDVPYTKWYRQMKEAGGDGFFVHGSEGIISFPTRPDKKYISYIREIGSKETYEPLAILLVTIDTETIQAYFEKVSAPYDSQFFIVDGNGRFIVSPNENQKEYEAYLKKNSSFTDSSMTKIGKNDVIMVSQKLHIQDWRLIGSFCMESRKALEPYYTTAILLIMCLNIIFVFICSVFLTKLIFAPLSKLENHMVLVEEGKFVEMAVDEEQNEITSLKKVFNHMIRSIRNLIQKVKEEEQIIAKGKLDLIQAQINPHFLYNTLDAVSALALVEDHENCFRMTQALGTFYRNSLNSGLDFVTVADELECIKSYMLILNIRYGNRISMEYDIEEEIRDLYIIKLLLQPVVENAVHHGIKENGGQGIISIRGYRDEEELIFIVSDNGCGMDEEQIEKIMSGKTQTGKSGFGVSSLVQRIRLYYQIENPVSVYSEIGSGTEVIIRVGIRKRGELK